MPGNLCSATVGPGGSDAGSQHQAIESLQELGRLVAVRRRQLGLLQIDVAAQVGITAETLSRFERGRLLEFGTRKLMSVLAVLGMGVDLIQATGDGTRPTKLGQVVSLPAQG